MTHYVLVGNDVASTGAIEAVHERDEEGDITVISEEPHLAYSRPLISYLLEGEVGEDEMLNKGEDFYCGSDADIILDTKAETVNPAEGTVSLDDGSALSFDKLLVVTGGVPILPEVEGTQLSRVFTLTKWEDVRNMRKYMGEEGVEDIAIVGGGLIGLKTTEALLELGKNVTVLELAGRIMAATFDRKTSDLVLPVLEEEGCEVITEDTLREILGEESVEGTRLRSGGELDCDMVVFAIGVLPNMEVLEGTEVEVDRRILIDEGMRTNIPDIYAAGDVVEIPDMVAGKTRPIPIWPNARRQGEIAGANMAGCSKEHKGSFAMNSVEICDVPTIFVGLTDPDDQEGYKVLDSIDEDETVYKKLVLKGDKLVGMIFVNDIQRPGIYTGLIRRGIDVSTFEDHLLDDDFGLIHLPESYREDLLSGGGMEI